MMKTMKSIFKYSGLALLIIIGVSCSREDLLQESLLPINNTIMLDIASTGETKVIESDVLESESHEAYVENIDIFIFGDQVAEAGQTPKSVYYEKISYSTVNPGQKVLSVKKSQFVSDADYEVYVIANSTLPQSEFEAVTSVDDLKKLIQADEFVHMSGLEGEGIPKHFLMNGRAYSDDAKTQAVLNPSAKEQDNVVLKSELERAAAKILVELYEAENIEFENPDNAHVYHIRNLPYNTSLISGYPVAASKRQIMSTLPHQVNDYIVWNRDVKSSTTPNVSVTAYVYEYDYTSAPLDEHTSLVINIPMKIYEDDGLGGKKETLYEANYYKIPLSRNLLFERNHMYRIKATVNAPGAQSNYEPIELDDLSYEVIDWTEYLPIISVGDALSKPQYLQLNTDFVKMYNVNEDNESLTFASSSPIVSIELLDAYYYNKHGVKTNVDGDIRENISATAEDRVLNGTISIFSPIVALSEAERLEKIAALGPAPSEPSVTRPVNPEVVEVGKPNPDDYLPASNILYSYYYEGSEGSYIFYRKGNFTQSVAEATDITENYNTDYAAYLRYLEWSSLSEAEKQQKIDEYLQAIEEYEAAYSEYNAYYEALAKINATSTPSHQNTIRYLTFRVTNEQGLVQEFSVEQYPVIFITNSLGWYSYRKDFKITDSEPTTYEYRGDGIVSVSLTVGTNSWSNDYSTTRRSGYWFSKARPATYNTTGNLRTQAYGYGTGGAGSLSLTNASDNTDNLRLYHVNVTTTSEDYIVGRPKMVKMTNVYEENPEELLVTDPSDDNKNLVSPSFMIASRLGYFITDRDQNLGHHNMTDAMRLEVFRKHCANYVEVHGTSAADRKVYDNWRLPTEAELKIIMNIQGEPGENASSIDYMLNAVYYFGAHGPVYNSKNDDNAAENINSESKSVRCVRDEY